MNTPQNTNTRVQLQNRKRAATNIRQRTTQQGNVIYWPEFTAADFIHATGALRPDRRTFTGHATSSLDEAKQELAEMKAELEVYRKRFEEGKNISGDMFVGVAFDRWYAAWKKDTLQESTQSQYEKTSKLLHKYFYNIRVEKLTYDMLRDFARATRGKSVMRESVIDKHLSRINMFLAYMDDAGLITKNVLANKSYLNDFFGGTTQRKKETIANGGKKEIVFLDPEQRDYMLEYMRYQINWDKGRVATQVGLIANLIAATTGLRHQEIQALVPSDFIVYPEGVRISVTKAYREKEATKVVNYTKNVDSRLSVAMPLWAYEIIERYLKRRDKYLLERGLWFENLPVTMSLNDHTHMANQRANTQMANNYRLAKLLKEAGFGPEIYNNMTVYGWRHSIITAMTYRGMLDKDIAPLMGHTAETLRKYYDHPTDSQVNQAAFGLL